MIRIWLGPEDIARTRIASAPSPLHEIFISLAGDRADAGDPEPAWDRPDPRRWLTELRRKPPAQAPGRRGSGPDSSARDRRTVWNPGTARPLPHFLAALPENRSFEGLLARLLTAPIDSRTGGPAPDRRRTKTGGPATEPSTARRPAPNPVDRDLPTRRALVAAIRAYHDRRVADELAAADSVVRFDVAERSRALATSGVAALLDSLRPLAGWDNPVFGVPSEWDFDLRSERAGLVLVPSVFARHLWVGGSSRVAFVVYPVRRLAAAGARPTLPEVARIGSAPVDPLTALLGRSRAAVLRAARVGANTTDLARRAGISTPSASQHATVLRAAGLLATTRHGKAAHHTLTPLARVLLTGDDVPSLR